MNNYTLELTTDNESFTYESVSESPVEAIKFLLGEKSYKNLSLVSDNQWKTPNGATLTVKSDEPEEPKEYCHHCGGLAEYRFAGKCIISGKVLNDLICTVCGKHTVKAEVLARRKKEAYEKEQAVKSLNEKNEYSETQFNMETVGIGDIFYCSWGYSMTIVDWYQVVELSKTGKSCKVRSLQSEVVSGDPGYSGEKMPVKNNFISEMSGTKRLTFRDRPTFNHEHGYAYKWRGNPQRFDNMD